MTSACFVSYVAHVNAGFEPREQWAGDYMVNGHWVAQFGMLAIEPLFDGRPPPPGGPRIHIDIH